MKMSIEDGIIPKLYVALDRIATGIEHSNDLLTQLVSVKPTPTRKRVTETATINKEQQ
jgi:hypothetical protein